ncbi:MAG: protein kinase [Planctomycetota bacterium]|nr:protein kinase [Planctomycetota bacterium]
MVFGVGEVVEIPGYRIEGVLGKGAMGVVYKAIQLSMKRVVAIKVLSKEFSSDSQFTKRFLDEARAMGKLRHENIVSAIDAGCVDGTYYFVMDYVDGVTVDVLLKERKRLGVEEAFEIGRDVASALDYAHSKGLVHRDVKPGNIIIDRSGVAKLCDLGLARPKGGILREDERGKAEGTPFYISPEQALGEVDIDHRSDIYSLGASLYHMVTGSPPFQGGDVKETMRMHVEAPLVPVRDLAPDVDERFAKVIEKMLSKEGGKRYQSARDVREDIEAVLRGGVPRLGSGIDVAEIVHHKFFVPAVIVAFGVIMFLVLVLTGGADAGLEGGKNVSRQPMVEEGDRRRVERVGRGVKKQPIIEEEEEERRRREEVLRAAKEDIEKAVAEAKNLEDLKAKMEVLFGKYRGTAAEGVMKEEYRSVEERIKARQNEDRVRMRLKEVEDLLSGGDYKGALERLESLDVPESLYAQKDGLRERIERANKGKVEELAAEVGRLLEDEKIEEARSGVEELFKRSIGVCRERLNELRRTITEEEARKKEERAYERFRREFPALVSLRKFQEASEVAREVLGSLIDKRLRKEVEREKFKVDATLRSLERLKKAFSDSRGQEISFKLWDGGVLNAKVVDVKEQNLVVEGKGLQRVISIFDIDVGDLLWLLCGKSGAFFYDGGIYFLVTGRAEKGYKFFVEARRLGVNVDKDWFEEAQTAANLAENVALREAIEAIEGLLKRGEADGAAKRFEELLKDEGLKKKEFFKEVSEQLRRKVRKALVEEMMAEGLKGLVDGTLKQKRGGEVTLEYRFSADKQFDDWFTDNKSGSFIRKASGGGVMVGGAVFLKVSFEGDVEVEVNCVPQNEKPGNVGILLKVTQEGAYLFGLDYNPTGGQTLDLPHHPKGGLSSVALPANIIVRFTEKWKKHEGVFGIYTPKVSANSYYKVVASHEGDKLRFVVNNARLVEMEEKFDNDERGFVGFLVPDKSLKVTYIRVTGKIDDDWLQNIYEMKVVEKYPYLGEKEKK